MTRKKRFKENKNTMRDALTNKRIGNKQVISVDNAIDYVKKQGFLVVRPRLVREITMVLIFFFAVILSTNVHALEIGQNNINNSGVIINIPTTFEGPFGPFGSNLTGNGTGGFIAKFNNGDQNILTDSSIDEPVSDSPHLSIPRFNKGLYIIKDWFIEQGIAQHFDNNNLVYINSSQLGIMDLYAVSGVIQTHTDLLDLSTTTGVATLPEIINPIKFDENISAPNICYSNGSNCKISNGGMDYTNVAMINKSNKFDYDQNFTNVTTTGIYVKNQTGDTVASFTAGGQLAGSYAGARFGTAGDLILNSGGTITASALSTVSFYSSGGGNVQLVSSSGNAKLQGANTVEVQSQTSGLIKIGTDSSGGTDIKIGDEYGDFSGIYLHLDNIHGVAELNTGSLSINGNTAQSKTITVRNSTDTGTCTMIFTNGLLTGGTC